MAAECPMQFCSTCKNTLPSLNFSGPSRSTCLACVAKQRSAQAKRRASVRELKERNAELEKDNTELKKRIVALEARLAEETQARAAQVVFEGSGDLAQFLDEDLDEDLLRSPIDADLDFNDLYHPPAAPSSPWVSEVERSGGTPLNTPSRPLCPTADWRSTAGLKLIGALHQPAHCHEP